MSSIAGRVMYTVTFFVMSLLAFVLRVWGKEILSWVPGNHFSDEYLLITLQKFKLVKEKIAHVMVLLLYIELAFV